MRIRSRLIGLTTLLLLVGATGVVIALEDTDKIYSVLEKAFYLTAEDGVWVRPGYNLQILDVSIPADRRLVVTYKITDDKGLGLDRLGNLTPGTAGTSWILGYIPRDADQYVTYTTRTVTSPITGVTAVQAGTDSGGTYTSLGDGNYTYRFATALPATYDTKATHTLGIYGTRNLTEWKLSIYAMNELKTWVPDGSPVTKIREVSLTVNCNQCHNPLALHGGSRRKLELCILCHTPQTKDPDTGNTVDMKVMTHKIHYGKNLPSVKAGKPYQIIGNAQSLHDYSTVGFPQDVRNCTTCHKNSKQTNNYMLKPSRDVCGACHDDVNWVTGDKHIAGPQLDDKKCASCHTPEGEFEFDASITGAHTVLDDSVALAKPKAEIVSVTNFAAGQKPVVQFKLTDRKGNAIAPNKMTSLALLIAGPTSEYSFNLRESALNAAYANGVATYTFNGTMPSQASGTYAAEIEGYINTTLAKGTPRQVDYRDAVINPVKYFAVTGTTITPRRQIVDIAKCNVCHDKLQLHGNNRNQIDACVMCHNPTMTDVSRRPAAEKPDESVDMKNMIHKIHTGEELTYDYTVFGFGGSRNNFNEVRYPGDRRDCLQCHLAGTYTVPVKATLATTTPRGFMNPTKPTAAACLGCHDTPEAAAHAYVNTASFAEACKVCHQETATDAVSKVHAR